MNINRHDIFIATTSGVVLLLIGSFSSLRTGALNFPQSRLSAEDSAFEASQTAKLLGVSVQEFPAPQGLAGFDELPANARPFKFTLMPRQLSGPPPPLSFETRKIVKAQAPDGTIYEAYCGYDDPTEVLPGHGHVATFENRRQYYENHLGYGYMPKDIYIGKRQDGRIKPTLFFRDVGSHTTAPHHLAIDNQGLAHLAVADVNISQDNQLDLYWVIGDPKTGKWNAAWLIDRRGFTSSSHPWSAAWSNKVHLLWDWCDLSINKGAPGMGVFHVEWAAKGFGRKTRLFAEPVNEFDAAVDQESGRLVVVLAKEAGGVYVVSRLADGEWTKASLLDQSLSSGFVSAIFVSAVGRGTFVIRISSDKTREWLLRPM